LSIYVTCATNQFRHLSRTEVTLIYTRHCKQPQTANRSRVSIRLRQTAGSRNTNGSDGFPPLGMTHCWQPINTPLLLLITGGKNPPKIFLPSGLAFIVHWNSQKKWQRSFALTSS